MQFIEDLTRVQDEKYRLIIQPTIKEGLPLFGVRALSIKEIAKRSDFHNLFLEIEDDKYLEQRMIRLHILALSKIDEENRIELIDSILPYVDSWALCDSFCSALKTIKKHKELYIPFIEKQSQEAYSYRVRFALVLLNTYFHNKEDVKRSLSIIKLVHRVEKEIVMAKGWAIVTMLSHNPEAVISWYKKSEIDEATHRIVLQKARESRIVEKESIDALKRERSLSLLR